MVSKENRDIDWTNFTTSLEALKREAATLDALIVQL